MPCLNQLLTTLWQKFHVSHLISLKRERRLGTQMKATGEVMAIGRNIEESLLKACRSLEIGVYHNEMPELSQVTDDQLVEKIVKAQDDRLFYLSEALRRGYTVEELAQLTKIDLFFLDKLLHILEIEQELATNFDNIDLLKKPRNTVLQTARLRNSGDGQNPTFVNCGQNTRLSPFTRW